MSGVIRTVGQIAAFGVGYAIGGPLGGALANTVFQLLVPPTTPEMGQEGTRLSDLLREGSEYGTPIKTIYGVVAIKGDVIDCGFDDKGNQAGIEEVVTKKKKKTGTGGGGGSTTIKEYNYYFNNLTFLLCSGVSYTDQIIIDDSDGPHVIYDRYGGYKPEGRVFTVEDEEEMLELWLEINGGLLTAGDVAIRRDDNNAIYRYNGGDASSASSWVKQLQPGETGHVFTPEYEDGVLIAELSEDIRMYPGTERQKVDTALAVVHGDDAIPYRGQSIVVFHHYGPLNGNSTLIFLQRSSVTGKREIIKRRLMECGIPESRINIDSITGSVEGAIITQVEPVRDLIEKIAAISFHDLLFLNGAFRDASRINPATWTISEGELGARPSSGQEEDYPSKTSIEIKSAKDLPSIFRFRYIDPDLNYEVGEAVSTRDATNHENESSVEVPLVMRFREAAYLADVIMDELWSSTGMEKVSLLPNRLQIAPGNVLIYPDSTGYRAIRITNQGISPKGALEMSGPPYDAGVYNIHRIVDQPNPRETPSVPVYTQPISYGGDLPAFDTTSENNAGIIIAAGRSFGSDWSGAVVQSTFFDDVLITGNASIGTISEGYTYTDDDLYEIDYATTITVQLLSGDPLLSLEEEDVLRDGANLLAIGNLLVSFVTSTPLGGNAYQLTGLLPGRYGTDHIKTVASGTKCVLLRDNVGNQSSGVEWVPLNFSAVGQTISYQVRPYGNLSLPILTQNLPYNGNNLRPPRILNIFKESDGSDGYNLYLFPRTRNIDSSESWWDSPVNVVETDPRRVVLKLMDGVTIVNQEERDLQGTYPLVNLSEADLIDWYGSVPADLEGTVYQSGTLLPGQERGFSV